MPQSVETATRTTDKRRIRGEESRQAIIEAAIGCIASRGLRGTTLETVAERAKVSRALVVFHFKSKNRMLVEVLNHLGRRFSAGWDAILAAPLTAPAEKLLRLLEFDVRFAGDYPGYVSVWHAFWGEAKGSTLYREVSSPRDRRYMADVAALVRTLADEGGGRDADTMALVKGIEAMLFGFWLDAHLNPGADRCGAAMRALGLYLNAVLPRHFGPVGSA